MNLTSVKQGKRRHRSRDLQKRMKLLTSGESKGVNRLMAAVNLSFSFRTHQSWTHQREGREHLWNLNLGSVRQSLTSRISNPHTSSIDIRKEINCWLELALFSHPMNTKWIIIDYKMASHKQQKYKLMPSISQSLFVFDKSWDLLRFV